MRYVEPRLRHPWRLSVARAIEIQEQLRRRVRLQGELPRRDILVVGCDVASDGGRFHGPLGERLFAAAIVLRWPAGEIVERTRASGRATFPYVPGLLSFREIPVLARCLNRLRSQPQLLVCDGQGLAHPRRFGLACHLGVLYGLPSLGIAKSRLCGQVREPGPCRGARQPIRWEGRTVGYALRTRDDIRPVFVSPGHRLTLREAVRVALWLHGGFRIPEPTRLADHEVRRYRQEMIVADRAAGNDEHDA